jgi:ankyrin repeat protein
MKALTTIWPRDYSRVPRRITGIDLAAYFGLRDVTTRLLDSGFHLDVKDNYDSTPLSYAAENGHETLIKLLLNMEEVVLDLINYRGRTPLWRAAKNGH